MGGWRERTGAARVAQGAVLPLSRIDADPALRAAWARLLHGAADPNPFYGPDFLVPLMAGKDPPCAVVTTTDGEGALRMLAFLPLRPRRALPGYLPARIGALTGPMIMEGTPLLDAEDPDGAASALIDTLVGHEHRALLHLPLCVAGRTRTALDAAALRAGLAQGTVREIARAAIVRAGAGEDLTTRKRKELRRSAKTLSQWGEPVYATLAGEAVRDGLEVFLALEKAGWKGAAGTALACAEETERFARAAFSPRATAPRVVLDVLRVAGEPVAAAIHILAGDRGGSFKGAYDERYAKASPGQLLDAWTREEILAGAHTGVEHVGLVRLDSCALPGHPLESLWTDRLVFADLLIGLSPRRGATELARAASRLGRLESGYAEAKSRLRRLVGRRETVLRPKAGDTSETPGG
ncbi:GNAT family N-acetyltransferase [Salinarimonas ramus]|uniref:BioF2-like acetyltransferase domain-containing protein n=1 Tax=Salinarimonas ramus TaxID=690164 RepID=A0A917V4F8_9HYPH|nr:GNAT family N-acetyltransferase [Salinarimonas ramus]GGK35862.1 hypothetical protein GCM10011322_23550 [Salinarimonas ramus]